MSTIKNDDLFVVQCLTDDGTYHYTGEQLKSDIQEFVADKDIKIWFNANQPPVFGEPDYAGPYDFWFDVSLTALFVAQKTTLPDVMTWVMANPGDKRNFLGAINDDVEFPYGLGHGEDFTNPNTGVTYYFRATRNQWVDTSGTLDAGDFVAVVGDTMTGALVMDGASIHVKELVGLEDIKDVEYITLTPISTSPVDDPFVKIKALSPAGWSSIDGAFGLRVDVGSQGASEYGQFTVSNDVDDVFVVKANGEVSAGDIGSPFMATEDNHLVTKKFTDETLEGYLPLTAGSGKKLTGKLWGTKAEFSNGILLKTEIGDQYIRTYKTVPGSSSTPRTTALYYDDTVDATRLWVENIPYQIVGTDGTNSDKHVYAKFSIQQDGTDVLGNYCSIHRLVEPVADDDAATKRYVDSVSGNYLPLTGGTLSGKLTIDSTNNGKIDLKGTTHCDIQRNGSWIVSLQDNTVVTNGLLKSTTTTGGAFEVRPDGSSRNTAEIKSNGEIKLKPDIDGSGYLFSIYAKGLSSNMDKVAFRVTADGKVKAGHDTSNPFIATVDNDVVTKKKLDDAIDAAGPFVEADVTGIKITKSGSTYYIQGGG